MYKRECGVCGNEQWRGSVMLVVVGAVIVMGVLGVAISRLSGSGSGTEIQQNRFDGAYYAAYSGLEYLKYIETNPGEVYTDIDQFVSLVNGGSPYTLPAGVDIFSVKLEKVDETSYRIQSLIGSTVVGSAEVSNFSVARGKQRTFTPKKIETKSGASEYVIFSGKANISIKGASKITGNIYANEITSEQVNITGNVIALGDTVLGYKTVIDKNFCSGGNASLNQSTVSGNANVTGKLEMKYASKVAGYARVGVSYSSQEQVGIGGDLDVGGNLKLDNWKSGTTELGFQNKYGGTIRSTGDVKCVGNEVIISGNVYSGGGG